MSVWFWTDLTVDVVVLTGQNSGPKKKKEKRTRTTDNTPDNRCVLGSDPACDSAAM